MMFPPFMNGGKLCQRTHLLSMFLGHVLNVNLLATCWVCMLSQQRSCACGVHSGCSSPLPGNISIPSILSLWSRRKETTLSQHHCLVAPDACGDPYFPVDKCGHCFNSLLCHFHMRIAIYINNQVWQHLPRLSHSVIKWPYVPENTGTMRL